MFIVVMAGAAAMAIDLGSYISHRHSLQNDVDAIALAASQVLPDAAAAQDIATEWADRNGVDLGELTITITQANPPTTVNPDITVELTATHD